MTLCQIGAVSAILDWVSEKKKKTLDLWSNLLYRLDPLSVSHPTAYALKVGCINCLNFLLQEFYWLTSKL